MSSKFKNKIVVIIIEIKDADKTNTNSFLFMLREIKLDNVTKTPELDIIIRFLI